MKNFIQTKISCIYPQINLLKAKMPFYTNLYSYTNISYWVKSTPSTLLLLKEEKQLIRVYFFTNDFVELEELITDLTHDKNLCIEILQKQPEIYFKTLKPQALYLRLRKTLTPLSPSSESHTNFDNINPKTLHKLLFKDFNPNFDHLPNLKMLQNRFKNRHILSVRTQNIIYSYLIFTHTGKSAYLNFIANYGDKQSLLEIWKVFYQKLNTLEVKFLHLWCDTLNLKALNMYQKENFSIDGLKNYIYIKLSKTNGGGAYKRLRNKYLLTILILGSNREKTDNANRFVSNSVKQVA